MLLVVRLIAWPVTIAMVVFRSYHSVLQALLFPGSVTDARSRSQWHRSWDRPLKTNLGGLQAPDTSTVESRRSDSSAMVEAVAFFGRILGRTAKSERQRPIIETACRGCTTSMTRHCAPFVAAL